MAQDDPASLQLDPTLVGRAERLRQSADEAARLARTLFITYLVIGVYIGITIAGTTDIQLLKISPVQLPLLDIGLPIVGFYAVVPWLFVLVHLNLLLQFYMLGRKLHAFNNAVGLIDAADRREQRERLFSFPLSHMLAGHEHSRLVNVLLASLVWTTIVILPLVLLIWAEVRFLAYRDPTVTWVQRAAVAVDLVCLWLFWPLIVTDAQVSVWWRGFVRRFGYHPVLSFWARIRIVMRWIRRRDRLRSGALGRWQRIYTPGRPAHASRGLALTTLAMFGVYGFVAAQLWPDTVFRRTLSLPEAVLVRGNQPAEVIVALRDGDDLERELALKRVLGLNLVERDLRRADLRNAVLSKADLRGARLEGADLFRAQLAGADLSGARLTHAALASAQMPDIKLGGAWLTGANLQRAQLERADLGGALLATANLSRVRLAGADLRRAVLVGADLYRADLRGANLKSAQLANANLMGARLVGADLRRAQLVEVDLSFAKLESADLRGAVLTNAKLHGACGKNVQLPDGYSLPPCDDTREAGFSSFMLEAPPTAPRITVHQD